MTREELEVITNKEFTIPRLAQVRDIFVFCCFTALAFIDVKQLGKEHIIRDNEGNRWINKDLSKCQPRKTCNFASLRDKEKVPKSLDFRTLLDFASYSGGMDGIFNFCENPRIPRLMSLSVNELNLNPNDGL